MKPNDRLEDSIFPPVERVQILLEEYRVLYGLLNFRLEAMDERLPLAGGAILTALGTLSSLSADARLVLLLTLPAAILWLSVMTVTHARSKEDVKRRIDELECQINAIADEELLVFQSQRSTAQIPVGGRTGTATIWAVLTLCLVMLGACGYLFTVTHPPIWALLAYDAYLTGLGAFLVRQVWTLRRYRYRKAHTEPPSMPPRQSKPNHTHSV